MRSTHGQIDGRAVRGERAAPGPWRGVRRVRWLVPGSGPDHTKALCPVMALPTMSVFISRVPSKE